MKKTTIEQTLASGKLRLEEMKAISERLQKIIIENNKILNKPSAPMKRLSIQSTEPPPGGHKPNQIGYMLWRQYIVGKRMQNEAREGGAGYEVYANRAVEELLNASKTVK